MRRLGTTSWQISVDRCNLLYEFPLWIRAAERIEVPPDPFVPGPLELEPLPAPTATDTGVGPTWLGPAWLGRWRTVIDLPQWTYERSEGPPPQVDFSGPDVERELGRPLRPIPVELVVLPVRDGTIRRVGEGRYLVPERIFDDRRMAEWLREELRRLG